MIRRLEIKGGSDPPFFCLPIHGLTIKMRWFINLSGAAYMKKIWFVLVCLSAAALSLTGCGGSGNDGVKAETQNKDVKAAVQKENQFPEFLAGTWNCYAQGLEIVIEPNGAVASAVMPFGLLKMRSEEIVEVNKPDVNFYGVFQAGPFTAGYKPETRELTVDISLKHYRADIPDANMIMEGEAWDIFSGKVSQDGTTWEAEWFSYFHDAKELDLPPTTDPNNNPMPSLIFVKTVSP